MKRVMWLCAAAVACVVTCAGVAIGQAPAAPAGGPAAGAAPGAAAGGTAPAAGEANAPAPGARAGRGAGRGGGRGGGQLTDADKAEISKLDKLPEWKPGAGVGDYFIGPDYANAPEMTAKDGVPKGKVASFTLNAADSKFYMDTGKRGASPTRQVTVYVPSQYVAGTPAPVIVSCDAYGARNNVLPNILDNMIADKRLPPIVAVMIANGGGDGPGSERGWEYDNMTSKYAEFVEAEILPKVEKDYNVKITKDPEWRMTLGGSSGGSAAFAMAWFHPEWYRKVLIYSGTFVNQHQNEQFPRGAWEFADHVVADTPKKPIRIWMHVSERDNSATAPSSGFHNWVIANIRVAEALKKQGYDYQFIYAKNAGHTEAKVINQTYPMALEFVWKGMTGAPTK